jgi:hypothetical protein
MMMQNITKALVRSASPAKRLLLGRSISTSPWANFELAPTDPIVGLNEIFHNDDYPSKVIVGVGAYRDDVRKTDVKLWLLVKLHSILFLLLFFKLQNKIMPCLFVLNHSFIHSFIHLFSGRKTIRSPMR